jgi:hypothetical protein
MFAIIETFSVSKALGGNLGPSLAIDKARSKE